MIPAAHVAVTYTDLLNLLKYWIKYTIVNASEVEKGLKIYANLATGMRMCIPPI